MTTAGAFDVEVFYDGDCPGIQFVDIAAPYFDAASMERRGKLTRRAGRGRGCPSVPSSTHATPGTFSPTIVGRVNPLV